MVFGAAVAGLIGVLPLVYLDEAFHGRRSDPASDVRLAAYDIVYVPRSDVADVYTYFNQYLQQFVPSAFGMSYSFNPLIDGK